MAATTLDIEATRVFDRIYQSKKKIVVNRGGTRSGKTFSTCQLLALWLLTGSLRNGEHIESGIACVVRKWKTTLKATVQRDFEHILKDWGAYQYIDHNKTDRTYSFDGRLVEFFGADDEQKLRGYSADILFCNEANELAYKKEFFQLLVRTRKAVFIDFNPSDPYVWIKTELEDSRQQAKGDVDVIVSTYRDNPFLSSGQVDEIEWLKETDQQLWVVYGLGQYGKVEGLIIPNVTVIASLPDDLRNDGGGMDFGFSNDPTSLVHCGSLPPMERGKKIRLYIDEEIYETGLTDSDIATRMKDARVPRRRIIAADSAQPGSIAEIRRYKFNVRGVKKFKNSVDYGIGLMRRLDIHVTARSEGFRKEQLKYKWKQDQNGNWTNTPIDAFNHSMDATRYYSLEFLSALMGGLRFSRR